MVFDNLVIDLVDEERDEVYTAFTCINDPKMADRCKNPDAKPVIYSIKANAAFNSEIATLLRDHIRMGKLKLLCNEKEADERLSKFKNYKLLELDEQMHFQLPYTQTTALIIEMINLEYEIVNGKIRVKEASGMRKDRYSSVAYNNYVCSEIERGLRNFQSDYDFDFSEDY